MFEGLLDMNVYGFQTTLLLADNNPFDSTTTADPDNPILRPRASVKTILSWVTTTLHNAMQSTGRRQTSRKKLWIVVIIYYIRPIHSD